MNFKKLSLILLVLSLSGHALMAGDDSVAFRGLLPPCFASAANIPWEPYETTVHNTPFALAGAFDWQLQDIANSDNQIAGRKRFAASFAKYTSGAIGLVAGLFAYRNVFNQDKPTNRILGTIGAISTTAFITYKALHAGLNHWRGLQHLSDCLDQHCAYLPQRINEPDINTHKEQITRLLMENAQRRAVVPHTYKHWATNARAQQTFFNIIRSDN